MLKLKATSVGDTTKRRTLSKSQMEVNATNFSPNILSSHRESSDKMESTKGDQKAASTVIAVKNAPASSSGIETPLHHHLPHHGQRPSLAGFDPFSVNEYAPIAATNRAPLSPHVNAYATNGGRKAFPSVSASQFEKRPQARRDLSPVDAENDARQPPPSPVMYRPAIVSSNLQDTSSVAITTPVRRRKSKTFSLSPRHEREDECQKRKFNYVRRGHRRFKSLEENAGKQMEITAAVATPDPIPISAASGRNLESSSNKSSSGIISDLLELKDKFIQLQIPTLAKPSPTSFLTGKGNEAVRTSYYEPSPFQIEIPSLSEMVEVARLNDFVENYRRMDQNFDLKEFVGQSKIDLQSVKIKEHVPIAQSLAECGDGLTVQGFLSKGSIADDRLEAVIFEGQRYFVVVFRGTTEQQTKLLGSSKTKRQAVSLDLEQDNVEVYRGFKEEYSKLEQDCFALIDNLTEQNPFCDVVFSGYSFGAAMATLAAFRYAMARPMMRVGCFTLASPKVGFTLFRHVVNSLPNLKVIRLEHGQDAKCQGPTVGGWHVGHTLVLNGTLSHPTATQKVEKVVLAYKFATPKQKKFKTTHPDLRNYINTLEEIARLGIPWVKDFANTAGEGVVVNNEARQVV